MTEAVDNGFGRRESVFIGDVAIKAVHRSVVWSSECH
jgi:hypothetical protein